MKDMIKKNKIILKKIKTTFFMLCILWIIGACMGCGNDGSNGKKSLTEKEAVTSVGELSAKENITTTEEKSSEEVITQAAEHETKENVTTTESEATEDKSTKAVITATQEQPTEDTNVSGGNTATYESKEAATPADIRDKKNRIVAIDPGHQSRGNSEKEPIGPGASEMKAKVAGGTRGVATGKPEYELTLEISIKLKEELISRGYTVVMIRETNDINISNAERAQIANTSGATAFLRIHADGSDNGAVSGATTLCPTPGNPYCANIYGDSRRLSDAVLESLCSSTGCKKRYVSEVDNMSGINWCQIPVSIVEVGFMTNADEDMLLSTEEYQWKVAKGIADGVDKFFGISE